MGLTPRATLSEFGVDNNVFNEPTDPKRDTTFRFVPSVEVKTRIGRASLSGTTQVQFVYFHNYADERSTNPSGDLRVEMPLNRITVRGVVSAQKTHDQPSLEIDLRAPRLNENYGLNADVRVLSRTTARIEAFRTESSYGQGAVVDGVSLRRALNQSSNGMAIGSRHAVTPLTTAVVRVELFADRFEFSPSRNSQNIRVTSGLEFNRFALISGSAFFGARWFRPRLGAVPDFTGLVASVQLGSVVRGATRLGLSLSRDLAYSYSVERPYYILESVGANVTQSVGTRWDLGANASWQQNKYSEERLVVGPANPTGLDEGAAPIDRGLSYGFSVGRRLSPSVRVSVDAKHLRRLSAAVDRNYDTWRVGGAVSYGF